MSYDRAWIPMVVKPPQVFWDARDAKTMNRIGEFKAEYERLWALGHYVTVAAGKNYLNDEIYLFENEADAMHFYQEGFRHHEILSDDLGPLGFDRVALYSAGKLVEEKAVEPSTR